jgi:N-methylhydantoinase B
MKDSVSIYGIRKLPMTTSDSLFTQVRWSRLIAICEEQARSLLRASFSSMAGEAEDFGSAIFDRSGRLIAQAESTGTVSILYGLGRGVKHMLNKFPSGSLKPGDVLIGNDPWLFSGHKYDVTVAAPIFFKGRMIGMTATCLHVPDVGGLGFGPSAKDSYEEGILIPIVKFISQGRLNQELIDLLNVNVRSSDQVIGDLMAQVTANDIAGRKVVSSLEEFEEQDLERISKEIRHRTETALIERLKQLPGGTSEYEARADVLGKEITVHCKLTLEKNNIRLDFTGTSPQVDKGVNCTLNVTAAFVVHALKCSLLPDVPNNDGFFVPIEVTAPEGCILNARWPAAVAARHMITTFVSSCVFGALGRLNVESVIAESAGRVIIVSRGMNSSGDEFVYTYPTRCGMGARPNSDGLSGHMFPGAVGTIPVEIVENNSPIFVFRKEFLCDSGGPGRYRGGCDQVVEFKVHCRGEASLACMSERAQFPARGVQGGLPGARSQFVVNGELFVDPKKTITVTDRDIITCSGGGGGGFYRPHTRAPDRVLADVCDGVVSIEAARKVYRVAVTPDNLEIDWTETKRLRENAEEENSCDLPG